EAFLSFLDERKTNPRYSILTMTVNTLSALSRHMDELGTPLYRPFLPGKMVDALVFKDGHDYGTNQLIGMDIAWENFTRRGLMLAALPAEKRAAFQYLWKGISLDENYNNLRKDKKFACLAKIRDFFPSAFHQRGFQDFFTFQDYVVAQQESDYNHSKSVVE